MRQNALLALLLLTLLLLTAGCGASSLSADAGEKAEATAEPAAVAENGDYGYAAAEEEAAAGGSTAAQSGDSTAQTTDSKSPKLIYNAQMELQTTDFDQAAAGLEALVSRLNGYFETNEQYRYEGDYRSATYVVRVPSENFQALCQETGTLCTQTYLNRSMEDVSEQYADTESRLAVEKTKHERLLTLLSQAEKMEDIIELENALAETEYEIDALSGALRKYDSLIGYATVNIQLREVYRVDSTGSAPLSFGERLSMAFHNGVDNARDGLESFILFVAEHFLAILLWIAALAVLIRLIVLRRRRGAHTHKPSKERKKLRRGKHTEPAQPPVPQSADPQPADLQPPSEL